MEAIKKHEGRDVSIRNLFGDANLLIQYIQAKEKVCEPYIQLVTNERDQYTGYKLSDIWRYFRYTWSIPYKTMPGRNLFYLVRDRLQPCHPVIGIFALGNSVLNLTVRDDDIGWTVEAIKKNMAIKTEETVCEQTVGGTDGKKIKTKISKPIETKSEHLARATEYADVLYPLLLSSIAEAISELYLKDLGYHRNTKYPKQETIDALYAVRYRNSYILLNTSLANRAIESNIRKPRFHFLGARRTVKKEYRIYDYKADLYLPDTDTIIEIKSIISTDKVARFPSVYSERTLNQFRSIQQLLKEGHKVCFFIVSLCPSVKEIIIDRDSEFYTEFSKCVQCGMQVSAYNCKISGDELLINKTLIIK